MKIKTVIDEDFSNYKVPAMVVAFPSCSFKCGNTLCQNFRLKYSQDIEMSYEDIVKRYINNFITHSIVLAGLEPFDSFKDMFNLILAIRDVSNDDVVIYTGYYSNEISEMLDLIKVFPNIIVKYGRYLPNQKKHHDNVLGIDLASDNQYAERLS